MDVDDKWAGQFFTVMTMTTMTTMTTCGQLYCVEVPKHVVIKDEMTRRRRDDKDDEKFKLTVGKVVAVTRILDEMTRTAR